MYTYTPYISVNIHVYVYTHTQTQTHPHTFFKATTNLLFKVEAFSHFLS